MELKFANINGRPAFIHQRRNVLSIALGENDVLTFDCEGRLVTAVIDDRTYRRGLDGRILEKWRDTAASPPVRRRRWLAKGEGRALVDRVHREAEMVGVALARLHGSDNGTAADEAGAALERVRRFDPAALERDAARFAGIYRPLTILPPDQYLALVLQVTEGCSYNRCSFCTFYRDRPFRVKSLEEVEAHAAVVTAFLGAGVMLRRSVFLADANALCLPLEQLSPLLAAVNATVVPALGPGPAGIHSFVDLFSDRLRTAADYAELAGRNVRRVYAGLETGSGPLLRFLNKPQTPEHMVDSLRCMKCGGLGLGAIVMLGIGGREFSREHVRDTLDLLNSIPWTEGDVIFLSELVDFPAIEYPELARRAGIQSLSEMEFSEQYLAIAEGIRRLGPWPKIAPYNAEEFIY